MDSERKGGLIGARWVPAFMGFDMMQMDPNSHFIHAVQMRLNGTSLLGWSALKTQNFGP